ncbi:hypothetical protein JCM33374_g5982 [Metschnikowia sp. JCM 33374]|nr:hypothetical protein JCM33374_g5982 [Metschnikowia sp. JCM 33374]
MDLIGIDVGSDSVRVSIQDNKTGQFHDLERPLHRKKDGSSHTMSAPALWAQIMSMLVEYDEKFSSLLGTLNTEISDGSILQRNITLESTSGVISGEPPCGEGQSLVGQESEPSRKNCGGNLTDHSSPGLEELSRDSEELPHIQYSTSAICVAATCSMVVMNRIQDKNAQSYFVPIRPGEEVVVWMDTRARTQAQWVARRLPAEALDQIGGTVTPEMGIAKLKWVDETFRQDGTEVCVFELFDWVTYVFLAGGYQPDGSVRCLPGDVPVFAPGSMAMDGSVKGWGSDILSRLEISTKVCCVPNTFDPAQPFPYVGTPLGKIGHLTVAHGCIDCYAGWAGQIASALPGPGASSGPGAAAAAKKAPCSLLMVAGTSTCFIASVAQVAPNRAFEIAPPVRPIPGLWGPFVQLLADPVYSFGQPATGKLFSELFSQYANIIGHASPFEFVEEKARDLERQTGHSLTVLARHFFYYGDKHGNRSPYGDFRMGEIFVDGVNASSPDTFQCCISEISLTSLVLHYYLTLEFLVFQSKQLCGKLVGVCGPLQQVYISGSQAQNARFVKLLAQFAFAGAQVHIRQGLNNKYAGSQGIALSMLPCIFENEGTNTEINGCADIRLGNGKSSWIEASAREGPAALPEEEETRAARILQAKYRAFEDMAQWQSSFHQTMGGL